MSTALMLLNATADAIADAMLVKFSIACDVTNGTKTVGLR